MTPCGKHKGRTRKAFSRCPLARREAQAEGRRPVGEGANIDRRLVPYHGNCRRIQSRIEFIYLFIYIYMYGTRSFL